MIQKAFVPWSRTTRPIEKPFREELLSIERLEERAMSLAAILTVDPDPRAHARSILPRFRDNSRLLRNTYRILAGDAAESGFATED